MKERLGDNYAACKLPTFTCGGEQVQMGSFLGCKILGVNTQTAHPVEAMELAEYLTNEQSQLRRFEALGYGPSNVNVAASEAVASEPALAALAAQSAYAISQHVLGGYWTPAGAFGAELVAHNGSDLQAMLDASPYTNKGTNIVQLANFGDSSINILVSAYLVTNVYAEFLQMQNDLNLNIMDIMQADGVDFAFPSTSVYIEKNS